MRGNCRIVAAVFVAFGLTACVLDNGPAQSAAAPEPKTVQISAAEQQRLKNIMSPLLQHMNKPMPVNQVKIAVEQDSHINAANAGGGNFLVTTGLLQKASDDQLRAILAH